MKTVVGMFDTYAQAETAAADLESAGVPRNDISLVASNESGQFGANPQGSTTSGSSGAGHAMAADAEAGAGIGGVLGLLAGASLFVVPGLGWLAGAGWFAGLIGGAVTGGIVGGLVGALTHIGVPHEDAVYYNEGVRRGGTLITVRAEDAMAPQVAQILGRDGAIDIEERAAKWKQEGFVVPQQETAIQQPAINTQRTQQTQPVTGSANEQVLPVIEEELQVGKRQVEAGGVRVYTHVEQRPVEQQVTLHEEHVSVDRRPVDRPVSDADFAAMKEQSFEIRETAEQPVVAKQARIVEEVVINKEATDRVETVRDTVRRTDVEVEQMSGSQHTSRNEGYDSCSADFRSNWQSAYGNQGGTFEQHEPAYRYGYDLGGNPQYRGQNWESVSPQIQREWNNKYPNTWDRVSNAVRYGFERAGNSVGTGSRTTQETIR